MIYLVFAKWRKQGDYKGCKCLILADDIYDDDPGFDAAVKWWDEFMDVYNNIDKYVPKADAKCASSSNTDAVAIEKSTAYKMGDKFCSDLDLSKGTKKDLTTKDIGVSNGNDFVFHFEYKPGKNCFSDCRNTIRSMVCKYSSPNATIFTLYGLPLIRLPRLWIQ